MSPSPFIVEWIARLTRAREVRGRALDVAMGRGRHTVLLARAGFRAFGVDVDHDAVREAVAAASAERVAIGAWCADLTACPLPRAAFDVVLVSRYLQRDLFPALRAAVVPDGVILYETFTTMQRALGTGPRSSDHLLEPGELPQHFHGFELLFYEETTAPEAVARIAARRPIVERRTGLENPRRPSRLNAELAEHAEKSLFFGSLRSLRSTCFVHGL